MKTPIKLAIVQVVALFVFSAALAESIPESNQTIRSGRDSASPNRAWLMAGGGVEYVETKFSPNLFAGVGYSTTNLRFGALVDIWETSGGGYTNEYLAAHGYVEYAIKPDDKNMAVKIFLGIGASKVNFIDGYSVRLREHDNEFVFSGLAGIGVDVDLSNNISLDISSKLVAISSLGYNYLFVFQTIGLKFWM